MVEPLIARFGALSAKEQRFSWLPKASDATLRGLYRSATSLIAASRDEGFGLPIVEAAKHGLPIIARDIPVFREVGCDGADYFSVTTGKGLSNFISD